MKLTLEDIKLISEEKQIMSTILNRYSNFDAFEEQTHLDLSRLQEHFRSNRELPHDFIGKLAEALGEKADTLLVDEHKQINNYINRIDKDINQYNSYQDINILIYLKDLCIQRGMMLEVAKLNRLIAKHYFMLEKKIYAVDHYNIAIDLAVACRNMNLAVKYETELAYRFAKDQNSKYAMQHFEHVMELAAKYKNQLENETLFMAYYRFGLFLYDFDQYERIREMMQNACKYTTNNVWLGSAVMNIGLTYKRQQQYDKVLAYYEKALEIFAEDKLRKSSVYNNIAEFYKVTGDYAKAQQNIENALKLLGDTIDNERATIYYSTYIQILMEQGTYSNAVDKLLDTIINNKDYRVEKECIIIGINTLIKYGLQVGDTMALKRIEDCVRILLLKYNDNLNIEFKKNLERCLKELAPDNKNKKN